MTFSITKCARKARICGCADPLTGCTFGLDGNWPIDCWTSTRIQICAIVNRHPEYTMQQVIEKLGPGRSRKPLWVQQIIEECRSGAARQRNKRDNRRQYLVQLASRLKSPER